LAVCTLLLALLQQLLLLLTGLHSVQQPALLSSQLLLQLSHNVSLLPLLL